MPARRRLLLLTPLLLVLLGSSPSIKLEGQVLMLLDARAGADEPAAILAALSDAASESIWFRKLKQTDGGYELSGYATNNEMIAQFMSAAEDHPRLHHIYLLTIAKETFGDVVLKGFTLTFQTEVLGPGGEWLRDGLDGLRGGYVAERAIPRTLRDISTVGKELGVDFLRFEPATEVQRPWAGEIPLHLTVEGDFHQVAAYLSALGTREELVIVAGLRIYAPTARDERVIVRMEATISLLVERSNDGAGVPFGEPTRGPMMEDAPFRYDAAGRRAPFEDFERGRRVALKDGLGVREAAVAVLRAQGWRLWVCGSEVCAERDGWDLRAGTATTLLALASIQDHVKPEAWHEDWWKALEGGPEIARERPAYKPVWEHAAE
ncbi:MAG: type 4a pilus biogenesis protein PilO [Proteobacteria bacterium]|nr:type 4a pilus biogenesis protein PilO [Pseudomonadota bacterium]